MKMKSTGEFYISVLNDFVNDHTWFKIVLYFGGSVIGLWLLGKTSRLLADAVINFKSLHQALKN